MFEINFIYDIWTDENIIKKQVIINSFLHCRISQLLDDSQDELFNWPDLDSSIDDKNEIGNIIGDLEDNNEEQK